MKNLSVREISFWYWLVQKLPYKLVYFCFLWVMVHASSSKYGDTVITDLKCDEAIKRYEKDLL